MDDTQLKVCCPSTEHSICNFLWKLGCWKTYITTDKAEALLNADLPSPLQSSNPLQPPSVAVKLFSSSARNLGFYLIYPLTARVVGAPQMILQPVSSIPRIFDDAPVTYLTTPPWCTAEGAVLVDPGGDRLGMVWLLVFIKW